MDDKNLLKTPKNLKCISCYYNTSSASDFKKHLSTQKHIRMTLDDKTLREISYDCNSKRNHCDYEKVCKTDVHNIEPIDAQCTQTNYSCLCGSVYKYRQGLFKHKKKCSLINNQDTTPIDTTLVIELLKQNQEFKELMIEQSKQLADQQYQNQLLLEQQQTHNSNLLEAVKDGKIGNTTNHNTNCNNKFNLNVFLNETCKDAITMDDFIKSFEVTRDDFIHTGNVGFIEGISTVMLNRFRNMEMHTRPLHCTDLKRETVYIKNSDKWEKEDNNKTHLRKAVKVVAHRNMKELWRWYNDSKPEVEQIGSDECENYFKYYKAALGGCGKDEDLKFEDKIIKNVLKEVQVDKTALTVL
jgi:hypothetical protein